MSNNDLLKLEKMVGAYAAARNAYLTCPFDSEELDALYEIYQSNRDAICFDLLVMFGYELGDDFVWRKSI